MQNISCASHIYIALVLFVTANLSSLNVHAPAFEAFTSVQPNLVPDIAPQPVHTPTVAYSNGSYVQNVPLSNQPPFYQGASVPIRTTIPPAHHNYTNGQMTMDNVFNPQLVYSQPPKPFNGDFYTTPHVAQKPVKVSSFNLNPLSKPFMPSNIESIVQPEASSNGRQVQGEDFAGEVYRANLVVKEGYVPKREVSEGFIMKRDVRDVNEGYIVKREVSNVKTDSEIYAVKSYESGVKSREDNVVKVHQSNLVKVNEGNVVNVQEGNEVNVQESVEVKALEDKVMKVSESGSPKVSESSLPKVSENKVLKVDDIVKVSDVGKSNSTEATKSGGGFMREQNSVIEKFAEEVTRNGVKQGLELDKVDPAPVVKEVEMQEIQQGFKPARRSWADIVSKGQKPNEKASHLKPLGENEKSAKTTCSDQESEGESVAEDNMALALGSKYIFFNNVFLSCPI